jgi:hypothetical protein
MAFEGEELKLMYELFYMKDEDKVLYLKELLEESSRQTKELCDLYNHPYPEETFSKIKVALATIII